MTDAELQSYVGKLLVANLKDGRTLAGVLVGSDPRNSTGSPYAIQTSSLLEPLASADDLVSIELQDPPEDDPSKPPSGAE